MYKENLFVSFYTPLYSLYTSFYTALVLATSFYTPLLFVFIIASFLALFISGITLRSISLNIFSFCLFVCHQSIIYVVYSTNSPWILIQKDYNRNYLIVWFDVCVWNVMYCFLLEMKIKCRKVNVSSDEQRLVVNYFRMQNINTFRRREFIMYDHLRDLTYILTLPCHPCVYSVSFSI